MRAARLENMVKGWFVGDFHPTLCRTEACEVAVKSYAAGASEALHHHKVATEITVIVSGTVRMAGREWGAGDIVILEPGETSAFEVLSDTVNVVVKLPGAKDDKYLGAPE